MHFAKPNTHDSIGESLCWKSIAKICLIFIFFNEEYSANIFVSFGQSINHCYIWTSFRILLLSLFWCCAYLFVPCLLMELFGWCFRCWHKEGFRYFSTAPGSMTLRAISGYSAVWRVGNHMLEAAAHSPQFAFMIFYCKQRKMKSICFAMMFMLRM